MKKTFFSLIVLMLSCTLSSCTQNSQAMVQKSHSSQIGDCNQDECSCDDRCACSSKCPCSCNS